MSRKQYSKELKLELVKKHLEDGISYWKLGKEYGIEASIIRRWGHKYETFGEDGLEKQNADLCNYSAEFKKKIVLEYLGGNITSQDLAAKYKIHAPSTVRTWIKQYNNPLVFDTFDKAVATNPGATPLLHSDRGYQYTSKAFRRRILAAGMTQSMSRVARCIDNGPMEGFWGLMKREMYYGKKYKTKEELMLAIAVLVSLYEYAIQSENEKLCGKIKEVFDLQFDDLPNRFRRLGLDDSLVCPSYVINTSFLQEKIKRTRDENPELRYHEDNEEYLIRKTKKQYTLSIRWRNGRHVKINF